MVFILTGCFVFLVAMDQLTKYYAVNLLGHIGAQHRFIPHILRLEYVENTGMAWGLLKNSRIYFIIITLLLSALMLYFLIKCRKTAPTLVKFSLTLILSGAWGNLIDRIFLGYVRDFLAFEFIEFPIFNVADCCVTVGAVILVIALLFTKQGKNFIDYIEAEDEARAKRRRDRKSKNAC